MSNHGTTAPAKTTAHTCGGPVFGRKTAGCPRCDELLAGAAPVAWNIRPTRPTSDVGAHFRSARHLSGGCGPVCTFGDW
jgi:hypothetical protein